MKDIIEVKNLSKYYYQYKVFFKGKLLTKALKNVSFNVKEGDFFGLIGANGAGKSTLLRIITTNMRKSFGEVYINGHDVEKQENKVKKDISWMFGVDYSGIGWTSLEKNMHMAAAFAGLKKDEATKRIHELLQRFDLYEKRKLDAWRLSSGLGARYSMAVALLKRPKILFLDEPLLGLDVEAKEYLRKILKEINKEGTTIVYTDHQLQEVEKVCKNLVIINKGEKIYQGSMENIKRKYRDANVLEVTIHGKNLMKKLHSLEGKFRYILDCDLIASKGNTHQIKIITSIDSKKALLPIANFFKQNKFIIEQMNAGFLDLEDVFKKFLKKDIHEEKARRLRHYKKVGEMPSEEFLEYLRHSHHAVKGAACEVFWKKHSKEIQPVLNMMLSGSKNLRQEALRVIGEIKDECFLDHLMDAIEDADPDIQIQAYIALGKFGNEMTARPLVKLMLEDETVDQVLKHINDLDYAVLRNVREVIKKLPTGDKEFIQYHAKKQDNANEVIDLLDLRYTSLLQLRISRKNKKDKIRRKKH